MNPIIRFCKFNAVGAIGMALQLTMLAILNRVFPGHYLIVSAAAVELTLLHNFLWHIHYTWRDRRQSWPGTLLRFHLSNGLISILGNLALMRLLVSHTHMPLIAANLIAIACCSLANFALGNKWAFAASHTSNTPRATVASAISAAIILGAASSAHAQTNHDPYATGLGTDCAYENIFAGPSFSPVGRPSFTAGVAIGEYFARTLGRGINASPEFELGIAGAIPGGHPVDGLAGFNVVFANKLPDHHIYPFVTAGYTRIFDTGNAANFGFGVDFGKDEFKRLIRIELRDYYLFTGPPQHIIGLRIGFGKFIPD